MKNLAEIEVVVTLRAEILNSAYSLYAEHDFDTRKVWDGRFSDTQKSTNLDSEKKRLTKLNIN